MILNEDNKHRLIKEVQKHWEFRTETLLHEIPIPLFDKKTKIKSLEIPKEHLSVNDFFKLDQLIKSQTPKFYLINEENEAFYTNHINTNYLVNSTIIDTNFEWIICTSIVFEGVGQSVIFGGQTMVQKIKELFMDKKEWFSEV